MSRIVADVARARRTRHGGRPLAWRLLDNGAEAHRREWALAMAALGFTAGEIDAVLRPLLYRTHLDYGIDYEDLGRFRRVPDTCDGILGYLGMDEDVVRRALPGHVRDDIARDPVGPGFDRRALWAYLDVLEGVGDIDWWSVPGEGTLLIRDWR